MRWFGGFSDPSAPPSVPCAALTLWPQVPGFWRVGEWPASELRTARSAERFVAVLGTCAGFRRIGERRDSGYWLGRRVNETLMDAIPADFPGPSAVRRLVETPGSPAPQT